MNKNQLGKYCKDPFYITGKCILSFYLGIIMVIKKMFRNCTPVLSSFSRISVGEALIHRGSIRHSPGEMETAFGIK